LVPPAAWLLIVFLSGCASAPPRPRATPAPLPSSGSAAPSSFITTFWCGPPLAEFDDGRAEEIVAAGFTIVGPPCEGGSDPDQNRRALDVAARHGLKMWIADARFNERARTLVDWEQQLAAAVASYKGHPALGGYFVTDEPSARQFEDLALIVARLRQNDPASPAYINLLADYVPGDLGVRTYRDYVDRFVETVRPPLLSYDYYPFGATRDRPTFFTNLALVREVAQRHELPFMLIVLAMPHLGYRNPSEAELSWQVYHALAYGARGISYFAYWTPVHVAYADELKFRNGLIEKGKPTAHYAHAMRLNRAVRAIDRQLAPFTSVSVGDSMGEVAARLPIGPIAAIEGAPITAGLFRNDAGELAVLLVNRDYRSAAAVTLRLRDGELRPQVFNADAGTWTNDADPKLRLPPGGAQLLRWPRHE
jgi:hypothetical protein